MEHPFAPLPAIEPDSEACWTACREGRLEMARCRDCRWFIHPARPVCPRCRSRDVAPEALSGLATVVTYTVNHQRWMPGLEVPYVIAIVELVEQRELRLTTNIVGCAPDDVHDRHAGAGDVPEGQRRGLAARLRARSRRDRRCETLRTTPATPPKHTDTAEVLARPPRRVAPEERLERRAILSGVGQSADRAAALPHRPRPHLRGGAARDRRRRPHARRHRRHRLVPGPMGAAPAGFAGPGIDDVQDALGLSRELALAGPGGPGADRAGHRARRWRSRRGSAATCSSTAR